MSSQISTTHLSCLIIPVNVLLVCLFSDMASLEFRSQLTTSDPYDNAVLIIGQLKHLEKLKFADVQCKFGGRVDAEV